jgi:putative acetyltransferase
LAVLPTHQKQGVGSTIVKHGLDTIASLGAFMVFVYGAPQYYFRFGFKTDLAQNFTPPLYTSLPGSLASNEVEFSCFS